MKHEFYYTLDIDGVVLYLKEVRKQFFKKKIIKIDFPNWKNFKDASMHEALGFLKDIEQNKDGKVKILDNGDGLFISHEVISTLSSFQAKILGLPPTIPYNFKIETKIVCSLKILKYIGI